MVRLSDLPQFAREAAETVREESKTLIPWLPDPYVCDDCGRYCDAEREFVANQAMVMDVWVCECGRRYHRDE